jgi:energy-coupling factor transporter transmembrane protein EcfT
MAGMNIMEYLPGDSTAHRLDPRLKLAAMAVISVSSLNAGWPGLTLLSLMIAAGLVLLRVPPRVLIANCTYLLFLLVLIIAARAIFTPGNVLFRAGPVAATREGIVDGIFVSWRLACIFGLGALLVMSTRVASLTAAAAWFLRPVPWLNEQRAATMLGLVVRFVPVIFFQGAQTMDAHRARLGDARRNPAVRLILVVTPMLRRIFLNAERLAVAMAARCYSDNRTTPGFLPGLQDAAGAAMFAMVCAILIWW